MVEFMFSISRNSETPDTELDVLLRLLLYVVANKHGGSQLEDTVPFPNRPSPGYDRCPEYTAWTVEQGESDVGRHLQGPCTVPKIRNYTVEKHLPNPNLYIILGRLYSVFTSSDLTQTRSF